jgi:hypothetical protein
MFTIKVYNLNGDKIVNEERNSGFGGVARCYVNSKNLNTGTYKISLVYDGNVGDEYPRAKKNMMLHISK